MEQIKKNNINIVGAGITGLSLLHFLVQKYNGRDDVEIKLFEKSASVGGTIHSTEKNGCLFETGPNGFLSTSERTFQFIDELNLRSEVIEANENAKIRFVAAHNKLHQFPVSPSGFLGFRPLNILDKLRFFMEPLIKRGDNPAESVYDFAKRRFGTKFADYVVDPLVAGIYAGDAHETCMKAAFPKVFNWEQENGSIFKTLVKNKKDKTQKPKMHSFNKGMGSIIENLSEKYKDYIQLNQEVVKVFHREDRYVLGTKKENFKSNEIYICTPAYISAELTKHLDREIADDLAYITYAPVVVIGLVCPMDVFQDAPKGFGYLIPSIENKEVLGVLFESNVFANRAPKNHILFRLMIGGSRYPQIHEKSKKELLELAYSELEATLPTRGNSALTKIDLRKVIKEEFVKVWQRAIPQYDQINMEMNIQIDQKIKRFRDLYLLGNYRNGVSFNDCIENAYQASLQSAF